MSGQAVEWRFEASLGLVGVKARDGRVLLPAARGDVRPWTEKLPAPVVGYTRLARASDTVRRSEDYPAARAVARIERVELVAGTGRTGELVASGRFTRGELGDWYAGALALEAAFLGMDLSCLTWPAPLYRMLGFSGWQLRGATMVADSSWDPALLSRPRVWRVPVEGQ